MTSIKAKFNNLPQDLLLLTALGLFIYSFFLYGQSTDFHIHDTYFVVSAIYFIWAIALVFLFGWIIYKVTNRFLLTKYLSWFHILVTIVIFVLMTANIWHNTLLPPKKYEYYSYKTLRQDQPRESQLYLPMAIAFVAAQFAYIVNLFGGLIKRIFKGRQQ